jgi:tRNA threonylcarbamoyl adenosine modification protein (Sua5/YciO/YrdC/YwlC family)
MAQHFVVHPQDPQQRLIRRAVDIVRDGGLMVYPTDSCYALGCHIGDKAAMERIRRIRQVDAQHHFTLVCRDLSEIGQYAIVNNIQYRSLKASTPGGYTFILKASREVPKRLLNPKRNTIGVRVPDHNVVRALLNEMGEPILSSTLILPGDDLPLNDMDEIRSRLQHEVEVILDGGPCGVQMTTVVDLTADLPLIVRRGKGSVSPFGVAA